MKVTKKAIALFASQFSKMGKISCSAVCTDTGTMPLWGQLARAELVKPIPCVFGHDFNYEITPKGKAFLQSL